LTRVRRAKHSIKTKRRSRTTQERAMVPSNAQFQLQGGKIESGFFSGSHLSSFLFWPNPPDPDPNFAPFYQRVMSGDLRALVDFYRVRGSNPGAAFYQCIGYLAACGSAEEAKTVQKITNINLRGGPQRSASAKGESVREWERRLLQPAQSAAEWISQQRKRDRAEKHPPLTRERLWQEHVDQNLRAATPGIRRHLESGVDSQRGTQPIYRISDSTRSSRMELRALVLAQGEVKAKERGIRHHITEVGLAHGIIPKELFLELARTTPTPLSPSVAVRRFARKLVR
jgi:hypothetical protein